MRKAREILKSKDGKRIICIDTDNWKTIIDYINQDVRHKKKFEYICGVLLDGHRNTDIYDKEDINDKCKDVTAMKFFKGQDNDRIYCKEMSLEDKTFVIIAAELFEKKKTQKNSKKKTLSKKLKKSKKKTLRKKLKFYFSR